MKRNKTTATLRLVLDVEDPRVGKLLEGLAKAHGLAVELEEHVTELERFVRDVNTRLGAMEATRTLAPGARVKP